MASDWGTTSIALLASILAQLTLQASSIGVNYGTLGSDLPTPGEVVNLYKAHNIPKMRLFGPDADVQRALQGTSIYVSVGVLNQDLRNLAGSQAAADAWVQTNVASYPNTLYQYLTVGNEVVPGPLAVHVVPAMRNLKRALDSASMPQVRVTTVVSGDALSTSYPPSAGAFSPAAASVVSDVLSFLKSQNGVLMINVYPYFAYAADPQHVSLEYAQFTSPTAVIIDKGLPYQNLFDAMVDAFYSAMEKLGGAGVGVAIAETGWPSAGNGAFTSKNLAQTYNGNLIQHVGQKGTPKRPSDALDTFIFSMFNENLKPPGVEQNFGLFYPNGQPVYPIF